MTDEDATKAVEAEETVQSECVAQPDGLEASPKKSKKKLGILGAVIGVIIVVGIGFWVWHNDPSFCNNPVCHDSMDPYVQTYYFADKGPAVDKWGNEVENSHAMLAVTHAAQGKACLDCHVADIGQQIGEVGETITGNYYLPLEEVDTLSLVLNRHQDSPSGRGDEFCMNESCHNDLTRESLRERTAILPFNPHAWQHEQNQCSDCHKSHRASTIYCTQCHAEAKEILPDGWVEFSVADSYEKAIYV